MRFVLLDTETTGLKVEEGHRVIEIGCIELSSRQVTENKLHFYLNPEREIDPGATQVHGMTWDQLKDKPRFTDIAQDFIDFVSGAQLIIHNAPFDLGFLNEELRRAGHAPVASFAAAIIDSLALARERHPGQRNSLDALCQRYGVSNDHRTVHGALLDAQLLADVYLAMTRGQESLEINNEDHSIEETDVITPADRSRLVVRQASPKEQARHQALIDQLRQESGVAINWQA
jgi:DNA polymerase III subunit epsilon